MSKNLCRCPKCAHPTRVKLVEMQAIALTDTHFICNACGGSFPAEAWLPKEANDDPTS